MNANQGKGKRRKIKARSKGNGIVIIDNDDPSYGNDSDSESDSETECEKRMFRFAESDSAKSLKSFDYLSEGENEVIQLRKSMYEFKSGGAEVEEEVEPIENQQNPPFGDEGFAKPLRMFDMGISDSVKEHEHDMDALMRRIKAKGCDLKDHFHLMTNYSMFLFGLLGEKFETVEQFKECLTYYVVANEFSLWYDRSSTDKVIAKYEQRKEVIKDPIKGKQIAYKKFPSKDPSQASSHSICPWSLQDHYNLLSSYAKALIDSNEGSTIKVGATVNPDEKTYFDRFYVCLNGLKEGWKLGFRNIIALDGCFLKKLNSGEILTVVGRDGTNQIYPGAWAIVNVENKEN
ncbi:hypothetical protein Tco_0418004 [Tanacetum coccineum]